MIPLGALVVIGLVLFGFSRILLGGLARGGDRRSRLVVAGDDHGVAAIVASRERPSDGPLGSMLGVVAGRRDASPGALAIVTSAPGRRRARRRSGRSRGVMAPKGAAATGFEQTTLAVPADKPIELEFDNQEPGCPAQRRDLPRGPGEEPRRDRCLHRRRCRPGPTKTTYAGRAACPTGSYFFHCEVHPATMTGTIEPPTARRRRAPAGRSSWRRTCRSTPRRSTCRRRQPTAITFDNEDAGIPHNIAIYTDASLSTALFQGEQFPGVATQEYRSRRWSGDVLLPLRHPPHDERRRGRRPARRGTRAPGGALRNRAPRVRRPPAEHSSDPC